jgi:HAE1 family hydrophobic/amphiphilic exporter-1
VNKGAKQAEALMKTIKGTSDVRLSSEEGKPELKVIVDRKKMAQLGLTITDVGGTMNTAFTGNDDSKFQVGINEYDIRVMLDKLDRTNATEVENITFVNSRGQIVELKQFAEIVQSSGPTKLERRDRISSITLYSNAFGRTSGVIANEFMEKAKSLDMPKGVECKLIGEQQYFAESMLNMVVALFAGILFVYMIMVALYDSFIYPFVVLFSIPLAVIGAFYGLALTSKSISIYSMLGIIMLVGLVAKNAILLVDRANQMKAERGLGTIDALIEAGQTRLRPILMTTFSMIMGMMPIAISKAAGGEAKSALGVVLIGGLASSMFMTLLVVPVVYRILDHLRRKFWHSDKPDTIPTI